MSNHSARHVRSWWPSPGLARQFTLASSVLGLVQLGVLGLWVSKKIEEGIGQHAAARTTLNMESFVAPHLQELSPHQQLSDENARAIDLVSANDAMRMRLVAARIWRGDGIILYATQIELVGQRFPVATPLKRAWEGYVEIQFDEVDRHSDPHRSVGPWPRVCIDKSSEVPGCLTYRIPEQTEISRRESDGEQQAGEETRFTASVSIGVGGPHDDTHNPCSSG